ncbi:chemosensory receptor a [Plakobranchus ocellatus]|uniref:Chemosensory receptor a n=1 Tax=Plakobranchus ocellatus TaxID=259542 RepID=A0AAV4DPC3_9GAST|nr:chemosensory receptor a [Plakobranchus ocellatus]
MLVICILTICPYLSSYLRYRFVWVYYPFLNATILDVAPVDNKYFIIIEKIVIAVCGVIQPLLAFVIVIVCTIFLTVQLKKMSVWRKSVMSVKYQGRGNSDANSTQSKAAAGTTISQKEVKLVRMVVAIATIFIVCFTPTCVLLFGTVAFEEFSLFGVYKRLLFVASLMTFLGQSISGSVNILIYYSMASKYRSALRDLLGLDSR